MVKVLVSGWGDRVADVSKLGTVTKFDNVTKQKNPFVEQPISPAPYGTTIKLGTTFDAPKPQGWGLADSKDVVSDFIKRGSEEGQAGNLEGRYRNLFDSTSFGFGGPANLGMDPSASSALRSKLSGNLQNIVGNQRANLLRQVPFDYSDRMKVFQGIVDADERRRLGIAANDAAAAEAAKQRRQSQNAALLGTAGTIAGSAFGPVGAAVGGGLGTILSDLF